MSQPDQCGLTWHVGESKCTCKRISPIRICKALGLHELGTSKYAVPLSDPMLPDHNLALRREMGMRLFNAVLLLDTFKNCGRTGDFQLQNHVFQLDMFNTGLPCNCDETELVDNGVARALPLYKK